MISGNLEYLMSSLPGLSFQQSGEGRSHVFSVLKKYASTVDDTPDLVGILDEEAGKFLSAANTALFRRIRIDRVYLPEFRQGSSRLLTAFSSFDAALRQQIAHLRMARRDNRLRGLPAPASDLITPGDPLQEEKQLLRLQWNQVEELAIGHYADLDALVAYKLKLMILLRLWSFDERKGIQIFQHLTKADRV